MSAMSELQAALYAAVTSSAAVTAIVGTKVYDVAPSAVRYPFVSMGNADHRNDDHDELRQSSESIQIDGWSRSTKGKIECKQLGEALEEAMHDLHLTSPDMGDYALATCTVDRVRVIQGRDKKTWHCAVQVSAVVERVA